MRTLHEIAGQPLMWLQPRAMKHVFELHCGDEVLGTIRWPSSWNSAAVAELAEGSCIFKRSGFRQQVSLEASRSSVPTQTLHCRWTGSATLSFPDGHAFRWKGTSFWGTRYAWSMPDGTPLVRFHLHEGFVRTGGQIDIEPFAASLPELALLVSLGWYLVIMGSRDAAAAAVTSSASHV